MNGMSAFVGSLTSDKSFASSNSDLVYTFAEMMSFLQQRQVPSVVKQL